VERRRILFIFFGKKEKDFNGGKGKEGILK